MADAFFRAGESAEALRNIILAKSEKYFMGALKVKPIRFQPCFSAKNWFFSCALMLLP
jgi:hypothetical protein